MNLRRLVRRVALPGLGFAMVTGCSDTLGVAEDGSVSLNFRVVEEDETASAAPLGPRRVEGPSGVAGPPLVIVGTNATLTIDEIQIVIDEVELHPADGSCDVVEASGDDCAEVEMSPRFLDLPLDGEPIVAVTASVPAGTYKRLDFEVEDLEDDETDPVKAAAIAAVRAHILAIAPDWPRKASTLITGSFAPSSGGSVDFRVFLDAEIEVRLDLVPNLIVASDGSSSREITVDVAPHVWFLRPDGTVLPLHLFDHSLTGELLELDVEMKDAFTEIEID